MAVPEDRRDGAIGRLYLFVERERRRVVTQHQAGAERRRGKSRCDYGKCEPEKRGATHDDRR